MPKLQGIEEFYYQAFFELGSERISTMSLGPIPRSKIKDYAEELELDWREAEAFQYVIYNLDIHYRNRKSEQAAKEMKK